MEKNKQNAITEFLKHLTDVVFVELGEENDDECIFHVIGVENQIPNFSK